MTSDQTRTEGSIVFTSSQLEQIAECLVSDRVTHRILDRKFVGLNISESQPKLSPKEAATYERLGLKPGVNYMVHGPSKRERLLHAVETMHKQSGGRGVLQLVRNLYDPVSYVADPETFRTFCDRINPFLRFSGVEYNDDGEFRLVSRTASLSEAEKRAKAVTNRMSSRRVHVEVQKYCSAEYMAENYFHAVFEATKGLAERIRDKTGLEIDGVNLVKQSFERPRNGLPKLAFNTLAVETERNEHDGFMNLLLGSFQMFRNPIAHTPKLKWQRDFEDAVDCLTLISFLNFVLDDCYPVPTQ